ncbi:GrpB family protein [Glycomyces tenuis]
MAQIAFRDALRSDDALARRYEDLKRQLSDQHGHDR